MTLDTLTAPQPLSRPIRCPACGESCDLVAAPNDRYQLLDIGVRELGRWQRQLAGQHACTMRRERGLPRVAKSTTPRLKSEACPYPKTGLQRSLTGAHYPEGQ